MVRWLGCFGRSGQDRDASKKKSQKGGEDQTAASRHEAVDGEHLLESVKVEQNGEKPVEQNNHREYITCLCVRD